MMKIGAVTMFATAQVALAKQHASRRSVDTVTEADRAVQCNRNMVANSLSNRRFSNSEIITSAHFKNKDAIAQQGACSCKSQ